MRIPEIVLPETKPETEWVRGRPLQKVSPRRTHARVQVLLGRQLLAWAKNRGEVGTEWRFRIAPPGEMRRPLVPDIAFVANASLEGRSAEDVEVPDFAPTIAVEILSPSDDPRDVSHKIDVYLRSGTVLAIVVDPAARTMTAHGAEATLAFVRDDTFVHEAMPGFALRLDAFFAEALDRARG